MHMKLSSRGKVITVFLGLVAAAYITGKFSRSTEALPPDFKDARAQGAAISETIVNTSNSLTADLDKVSQLEKDQKIQEAIDLTTTLLARSEEVKTQAQNLSEQLEKMTGALSDIHDDETRSLAIEAITDRLALISRLLSYSDYLASLLTNLKNRLQGAPYANNNQILISQINAEVTAINNFNRQATVATDKFDKLVR
jgi:uncharacterized protein (DUF885 family)